MASTFIFIGFTEDLKLKLDKWYLVADNLLQNTLIKYFLISSLMI